MKRLVALLAVGCAGHATVEPPPEQCDWTEVAGVSYDLPQACTWSIATADTERVRLRSTVGTCHGPIDGCDAGCGAISGLSPHQGVELWSPPGVTGWEALDVAPQTPCL